MTIEAKHLSQVRKAKDFARSHVPPKIWALGKSAKDSLVNSLTYPVTVPVEVGGVKASFNVSGPIEKDRTETLVHEGKFIELILNYAKLGSVFWDIGANIGTHAILFALKNPFSRVFAFEPVPRIADRLKLNARINLVDNLVVVTQAVSNQNGSLTLFSSDIEGPAPSAYRKNGEKPQGKPITVPCQLPCVLAQQYGKPDVVKIDIEGGEGGITYLIGQLQPKEIFMEIHPEYGVEVVGVESTLARLGYEPKVILRRGTEFLSHYSLRK